MGDTLAQLGEGKAVSAERFRLATSSLAPGISLLQASAGTGKTYAIEGIFVRLLIEYSLDVREILVVTFTEAATAELRDRVRKRLSAALEQVRRREFTDEALRCLETLDDASLASARDQLRRALVLFDEAQIFTIHGFCERTLSRYAFESGNLFDTALVTDDRGLHEELAGDFWRRRFYSGFPILGRIVNSEFSFPLDFLGLLNALRYQIDPEVLPAEPSQALEELEDELGRAQQEISAHWLDDSDGILEILSDKSLISQSASNFSPGNRDEIRMHLNDLFRDGSPHDDSYRALAKLSRSFIDSATQERAKKQGRSAEHPIFEACERFEEIKRKAALKALYDFSEYAKEALPDLKDRKNVRTFDDLLIRIYQTLRGEGSQFLRTAVGERYRAVLIDEFQDTDPLQWTIFGELFSGVEDHVYLIGDPKQAIYGFRGADIFTYMEAAKKADRPFTLERNWRSDEPLIHAVNTLFSGSRNPFRFSGIPFEPAKWAGQTDPDRILTVGPELPKAPLQILTCEVGDDEKLTKSRATDFATALVADEIVKLLGSTTRIGNRRIHAGDIAVLVRRRDQAARVQDALKKRRVSAVLSTDASVYESREATELAQLLSAVLDPGNEGLVKGALATGFFRLSADRIHGLTEDEGAWLEILEELINYREQWFRFGFMYFYRSLVEFRNVRSGILEFSAGERKVTNFDHIADILHRAETEQHLSPEGLLAWFHLQRADQQSRGNEEHQLRMESDERAVQLVTVHKSKGLEYPVVFAPFHWDNARIPTNAFPIVYHPEGSGRSRVVLKKGKDLDDGEKARAFEEELSSEIRLLYVSLTRARNRCYLVWVPTKEEAHSPVYSILCGESGDDVLSRFLELAEEHPGSIEVRELKQESPSSWTSDPLQALDQDLEESLSAASFEGHIDQRVMLTSFTAVTSGKSADVPDHDDSALETVPEQEERDIIEATGIFAFPKGPKAGIFFHSVFEKVDFRDLAGLDDTVREELNVHGIEEDRWHSIACEAIRNRIETPLGEGDDAVMLGRIRNDVRLKEVEFLIPVRPFTAHQLGEVYRRFTGMEIPSRYPDRIGRLTIDPVDGYMKGFIDLVFEYQGRFYLLDWKSNWLGNRLEDYGPGAVAEAMVNHSYFLQYAIYTVALERYLARRSRDFSYESNFGGVFYVFLRGVDPSEPGRGVFFDRPGEDFIRAVRDVLSPEGLGRADLEHD